MQGREDSSGGHMKLAEYLTGRLNEDSRFKEVSNMLNSSNHIVFKLDKVT